MPAISFSVMKDKLKQGEKTQTIRLKRSNYWLRYSKGDQLIGYWKQRSKGESEQLFKGVLSEDPFVVTGDEITEKLARKDGFETRVPSPHVSAISPKDNLITFLKDHYGESWESEEYVVLRWR